MIEKEWSVLIPLGILITTQIFQIVRSIVRTENYSSDIKSLKDNLKELVEKYEELSSDLSYVKGYIANGSKK